MAKCRADTEHQTSCPRYYPSQGLPLEFPDRKSHSHSTHRTVHSCCGGGTPTHPCRDMHTHCSALYVAFCRYDCSGTQQFIHLSHFFSRSVTLGFCLHANGKHLSDRIGKSCDLCLCLQILSPLLSSADSHNCLTDTAQLLKSYIL